MVEPQLATRQGRREMAVYRIVRIKTSKVHGRITKVECRKDTGLRLKKAKVLEVSEVREKLAKHHVFYTFGLKSLKLRVRAIHDCSQRNASYDIRSTDDATTDNNLDGLPTF